MRTAVGRPSYTSRQKVSLTLPGRGELQRRRRSSTTAPLPCGAPASVAKAASLGARMAWEPRAPPCKSWVALFTVNWSKVTGAAAAMGHPSRGTIVAQKSWLDEPVGVKHARGSASAACTQPSGSKASRSVSWDESRDSLRSRGRGTGPCGSAAYSAKSRRWSPTVECSGICERLEKRCSIPAPL